MPPVVVTVQAMRCSQRSHIQPSADLERPADCKVREHGFIGKSRCKIRQSKILAIGDGQATVILPLGVEKLPAATKKMTLVFEHHLTYQSVGDHLLIGADTLVSMMPTRKRGSSSYVRGLSHVACSL